MVIKMNQGIFITLEGNDGAGKTTLCLNLIRELEKLGYSTIYTREPGGSQIAEQIRNVLLKEENTNMDARTEALLFAASRRQHLVEVVLPAFSAASMATKASPAMTPHTETGRLLYSALKSARKALAASVSMSWGSGGLKKK